MTKVWSKLTRYKGKYIRDYDWYSMRDNVDTFLANNDEYTNISPPVEAFTGTPCDWINGYWVLGKE